ncbi:MAG: exodeoxyribonuclease I [Lysobacterales bacterium]
MSASFYFHDYETFGADPLRDRPAQFAGQRTSPDFEPIDDPLLIYCRPSADLLPSPEACLITGITPQLAAREGLAEPEFFARIHEQMAVPGSCVLGYNSIRFDDEFTRHGLWRNFFDPYGREWHDDCSRWDLIDLARMCYALRPEGVNWPLREDGTPSFRLEQLSAANAIAHANAHDALADVQATIALARLLRTAQPRLFDFLFSLRDKRRAAALLDWSGKTPVLHASSRIPAERGCLAMVLPIAPHPNNPNGVIVFDLDADPSPLAALEAEDIRDRVFVARADLPEDIGRLPLKVVHKNKCPALAPLSVLEGVDCQRIRFDLQKCLGHADAIRAMPALAHKLQTVFANAPETGERPAEQALYAGLPEPSDLALAAKLRRADPGHLHEFATRFKDARYRELLRRYRARHFPDTLSEQEQHAWRDWRRQQLIEAPERPERSISALLDRTAQLRAEREPGPGQAVLDEVESWLRGMLAELA